jgi:hypothetical protein
MSDYISALRRDLVEAAERQQATRRPMRVARPLLPRPSAILGAVVVAAVVVAVVLGLRALAPPRPPEAPKLTGRVDIGGQPRDAVSAGGYVFVSDFDGALLRFTPEGRGRTRIAMLAPTPVSLAGGGDAVWATGLLRNPGVPRSALIKIDLRSGRQSESDLRHHTDGLVLGAGGLWVATDLRGHETGLERIDPATFRTDVTVRGVNSQDLAASAHALWTRRDDAVTERDEQGREVSRVTGISPMLGFEGQHTMLADRDGAWVVGQSDGLLYRIERGRVAERIRVGELSGVIARTRSAVWVTAMAGTDRWELVRVDPDEGKVTGRVGLGSGEPQTIVPVGEELWVTTQRGNVLRVSQG